MKENHIDRLSFGMNGCVVVAALGSAAAGEYCAIQFASEGTLTALESDSITGAVGVTFPAGFVLYGPFSALTTGADTIVVAYKG